jgi:glycosyltransferase involved in cell wall biosynthesis/SAM-dependent methyltransferase
MVPEKVTHAERKRNCAQANVIDLNGSAVAANRKRLQRFMANPDVAYMSKAAERKYFEQVRLWSKPITTEQSAVADALLAMIPGHVRTILDAGCGNGVVTNRLLEHWDVVGCDASATALAYVNARKAVADLDALPFGDNAFDLVLASDVLEHLPDGLYARANSELLRVARRYLLIAVPHQELLAAANVTCPSCGHHYHAHRHQRAYSSDNIANLFAPQFGVRELRLAGENWPFRDLSLLTASRRLSGLDYPFEDAVCPLCGTRRGNVHRPAASVAIERRFEALQAMLSAEGVQPRPQRSEMLILFERGAISVGPVVDHPSSPDEVTFVNVQNLPVVQHPANHPERGMRLNSDGEYNLLSLPRLPRTLGVKVGHVESIDVYDTVRNHYIACRLKEGNVYAIAQVPCGIHGCLIRMLRPTADLSLVLEYPDVRSEADIVTLCFDDSSVLAAQEESSHSLNDLSNNIEAQRASLELQLVHRDALLAEREKELHAANELANKLEGDRATLDGQLSQRDALLAEREMALHAAHEFANKLEGHRATLEGQLSQLDALLAEREKALYSINELANKIEAKRLTLESQLAQRDLQLAEREKAHRLVNEIANNVEAKRAVLEAKVQALDGEMRSFNVKLAEAQLWRKAAKIASLPAPRFGAARCTPRAVLVLSHMYPRDHHPAGGIFVHDQVKALREQGIDVRVMSGEPFWINTLNPKRALGALRSWSRSVSSQWENYDSVPLIRFPYLVGRFLPFEVHAFSYAAAAVRFARQIHGAFDFELIHAHTAYLDGSAGAAIAVRFNAALVITEHTGPFRTLTRTQALRVTTRRAMNSADQLLAVSASLLRDVFDEIKLTYPDRARVVPNLVDIEKFRPGSGAHDNCIRALWVGHFVPVKRIPVLLEAFRIASEKVPRLRLRLVGSGEGEQVARDLVQQFGLTAIVEFIGHVDHSALPTHYRDCDFVVISSESETFGVVAIEAMSCGRPVLTTDCGGPTEIVNNPSLGRVVGSSIAELAGGLETMANALGEFDPELIRCVTELRFSKKAVTSRLLEVYQQALETFEQRRRSSMFVERQ